MNTVFRALFWVPTALLAWAYAGYPLLAGFVSRVRPLRVRDDGGAPRLVTVGIAAHDEASELEARIADILAQQGPFEIEVIVASDGSRDDSMEILRQLAVAESRMRVLDLPRGGQTAAQNEIFRVALGDVVVLSDAETRFAPGCLAQLVAPFADRRVGVTTGTLHWLDEDRTETSRNEGIYWRYEQLVRRLESGAGWLTAVTGALLAVRRSIYRPVPAHASMDHLLPLYARDQGQVVVAVVDAVAYDRGVSGIRDQFRNRSRTATRGIRSNLSMAGRLAPWRRPSAALAIWSHKILRWATPWLVGASFMGSLGLAANGRRRYLAPITGGLAMMGLATGGWMIRSAGGRPPRLMSLPLTVSVVNLAFLNGWLNVLLGRRINVWHGTQWVVDRDRQSAP